MNEPHQDDVRQVPGGFARFSEEAEAVDKNPVVHHLSVYKTRARMVDDSRIERRAKDMQAANSFDEWNSLSDDDKELWRHMARLELL